MRIRFFAFFLVALVASRGDGLPKPRVVNGSATFAQPAVAMLAFYADAGHSDLTSLCSGTLVGCHSVVTAAHCLCPENSDNFAECQSQGIADPRTILVFLPNVGVLTVEAVAVHPNYEFGAGYDVGLLRLAEPADGVPPLSLARAKPAPDSAGTVVGYGTTRAGFRSVDDTGIKREGPVVFGACPADVPADLHVCWSFTGTGSNTCSGDSGGAVMAKEDGSEVLVGVVSGGSTVDCLAPDQSFATDVTTVRNWIEGTAGEDVGVTCNTVGHVDDGRTLVRTFSASLSVANPRVQEQIEIDTQAAELRVSFNGQTGSNSGFLNQDNDFDLLVGHTEGNNITWVCRDERPENWGACRIERPQPGLWTIELRRIAGTGPAQVTATVFRATSPCAGDCNGDATVEISEIVTAVNIALGAEGGDLCPAADDDGDGAVTVDEIILAVNGALNGCSTSIP
ncbi:MAG: trypsin-like serine protease [Candidatus Binatia bacterium]|nr:trypsin-like serine protease [Candidatus Binatia bacterium]